MFCAVRSPDLTVLYFTCCLSSCLPPGWVKLQVFDVSGRNVGARHAVPVLGGGSTPTLQYFPAGVHHILFDGSDLPSGIYLARLMAKSSGSGATPTTKVQKLVLLK